MIARINDISDYRGADGRRHGFIATAVPEQGSLALMAVAGLLGAGRRSRRAGAVRFAESAIRSGPT